MNGYVSKSYIKERNLKLIKKILLDCGLEEKDDKGFHYLFKIIKSNKKIEPNIDYHNICDSINDTGTKYEFCINFPNHILIENDEEMFKNMVLNFLDDRINILEDFATFEEYNKINELLK